MVVGRKRSVCVSLWELGTKTPGKLYIAPTGHNHKKSERGSDHETVVLAKETDPITIPELLKVLLQYPEYPPVRYFLLSKYLSTSLLLTSL